MKSGIGVFLLFLFLLNSTSTSFAKKGDCPEGINLLPMYGGVKKCDEQLISDKEFLALVDRQEPDRQKSSQEMVKAGIYFLNRGDYDSAMKRMNQAWLLNNENIQVYAYFMLLLDVKGKTNEAIGMLDDTLKKIKKRKDPEAPTAYNSSNEMLLDTVLGNVIFAYRISKNADLGKYLYTKVSDLQLSDLQKQAMRDLLKSEIPEIGQDIYAL